MTPASLNDLLAAARLLTDTGDDKPRSTSLETVLRTRLERSCVSLDDPAPDRIDILEELQLATAKRALSLVTRIDSNTSQVDQSTALGNRDWILVRTLFSLVFNWGINAGLFALSSSAQPLDVSPIISDLVFFTDGILSLIQSQSRTQLVITLFDVHLADVLRATCTLGSTNLLQDDQIIHVMQEATTNLLESMPPARNIEALGAILASHASGQRATQIPLLPHARDAINAQLSRQLLRPRGIEGLLIAIVGDGDEDAPFDRVERVTTIICAVPATARAVAISQFGGLSKRSVHEYFIQVVPQLSHLLGAFPEEIIVPPAHRRAAAFVISQLLNPKFKYAQVTRPLVLRRIHLPLLPINIESSTRIDETLPSAYDALRMLIALLIRMDPSPPLISILVSPVVSSLFGILEHLSDQRTADPELREGVRGAILAWARVVPAKVLVDRLSATIEQLQRERWDGSAEQLRRRDISPGEDDVLPVDELLHPEHRADMSGQDTGDPLQSNVFLLRPDPARFVELLKEIGRPDASGILFVQVLETYRSLQSPANSEGLLQQSETDPRRPLLYLQLAFHMQIALPDAIAALAKQPDRLLAFIRLVLQQAVNELPGLSPEGSVSRLTLEDLRIVDDSQDDQDGADSDDEDVPSAGHTSGEMIQIALSILLSLLELHETLLAFDSPLLLSLGPDLVRLANDAPDAQVRHSAREAAFVLRARTSAADILTSARKGPPASDDSPQAVYQRALVLLTDPLMPVRASGIAQLRSPALLQVPALRPGILDALLRVITDGESFLYLNAVQGLVALALSAPSSGTSGQETSGRGILASLVRAYAVEADGLNRMPVSELDRRLRVGEALGQVILHLQDAVASYLDIVLPGLFATIRATGKPTVLRASALSLLGRCLESAGAGYAMARHASDIGGTCVDVLQTETETEVPSQEQESTSEEAMAEPGPSKPAPKAKTLDDDPTSSYTKHPPLRRAAAHVLTLLLRVEAARGDALDDDLLRRMRVVLGYAAVTDRDLMTRTMSREAVDAISDVVRSRLAAP